MAKRRIKWTEQAIQRRIDQGFGRGAAEYYKPWLRIQDFASRGRVHRIKGMKTGRVHHLFSDLEANWFHSHDFNLTVTDIREQYPLLPLEETMEIAKKMAVRHPTDPFTGQPTVMTTDLFLTVRKAGGFSYLARSCKYRQDLVDLRTLEKLEIERRYWQARGIDWNLLLDCDLEMNFVLNVKWFRPYFGLADLYPLTPRVIQRVAVLLTRRLLEENFPLCEVASNCDEELGIIEGSSLAIARHLLATNSWRVDMRRRIEPCEPLVLLSANSNLIRTGSYSDDRTGNADRISA